MVKEFHQVFGHPIATEPNIPDFACVLLRRALIKEEYEELVEAILYGEDLPHIAKEMADLSYVLYGAAIEYGIDLDKAVAEVHRSNMSKLGSDGKPIYREDGKVLKSSSYQEPDMAKVVFGKE